MNKDFITFPLVTKLQLGNALEIETPFQTQLRHFITTSQDFFVIQKVNI